MSRRLILASSSPYRRELLQRLRLPFEWTSPSIDESRLPEETPVRTASRLARAKASAAAPAFPGSLIIGSDQVAYADAMVFGKPLERRRAVAQLRAMRGRSVIFHTALCLLDSNSGRMQEEGVATEVRFRELSDPEIERYVDQDEPYDCAGSAKAEGMGISLLEYIRGDDPNALIGLPLIALCRMLRAEGVELP